ncbi:hypothetical protein [Paenibacillus albilobatus]|uniref:hypothetical protein n=1 Tax=Paenibacillus albilobatus TaxID=2716884 RepID=UPI001FD5A5C6|nr:hypothetical protein [Paenibacillus albilobatus]
MLYHMWVRHHLRPGAFWCLPKGERLLLQAFTLVEIDNLSKPRQDAQQRGPIGRRRVGRG